MHFCLKADKKFQFPQTFFYTLETFEFFGAYSPESTGTKDQELELQWLEHLWNYENLFETGVVRANEGLQ